MYIPVTPTPVRKAATVTASEGTSWGFQAFSKRRVKPPKNAALATPLAPTLRLTPAAVSALADNSFTVIIENVLTLKAFLYTCKRE